MTHFDSIQKGVIDSRDVLLLPLGDRLLPLHHQRDHPRPSRRLAAISTMKKKQLETFLYSTIGVVAMALILIAINFIAGRARQRVDLTAENAYTLSPGPRRFSRSSIRRCRSGFTARKVPRAMPVFLKTYAQRVDDLLGEYRQASKGQIEIQKLDPEPDSDAEDSARLDGVEAAAALATANESISA